MIPEIKTCTKCKVEKSKEEFRFRNQKNKLSVSTYLSSECKCCEKLRNQIYIKNNPKKVRDRKKAYRDNNREKVSQSKKAYRDNNREKVSQSKKAYRLKKLDRCREIDRNYYYENLEKMQNAKRLDYQKHREKRIETCKVYHQNNPEIAKKSSQNWRNNHPDKVKQKSDYERKEMVDSYIVEIIKNTSNLSKEEIRNQPELIRLTRTIIQIKRKIKNEQENELSGTC